MTLNRFETKISFARNLRSKSMKIHFMNFISHIVSKTSSISRTWLFIVPMFYDIRKQILISGDFIRNLTRNSLDTGMFWNYGDFKSSGKILKLQVWYFGVLKIRRFLILLVSDRLISLGIGRKWLIGQQAVFDINLAELCWRPNFLIPLYVNGTKPCKTNKLKKVFFCWCFYN